MLNVCAALAPEASYFEGHDMDAVEAELATTDSHINAAIHRRLELIRLIDASGRWAQQGAKSCAHWLSWRLNLEPGTAREQVRVANKLRELPRLDEELRHARISYSQARAITRVATAENEERLIELATCSTAAQLERIVRGVRQADTEENAARELERWVRQRPMGDGTVRVEAQLTVDEAALVMEAIQTMRAAMRAEQIDAPPHPVAPPHPAPLPEGRGSLSIVAPPHPAPLPEGRGSLSEGRGSLSEDAASPPKPSFADAFVRMAEQVEARRDVSAETSRTGGERTSLVVHLSPDLLAPEVVEDASSSAWAAQLDDGTRVSAETFRRIACDCSLLAVSEDERGDPLDVGRKTRKIPGALRRALMLRDRGCAFPGCTHDRFVDCHHIEHWLKGGATSKDNLVVLCTFHHGLVHEGGWSIAFDAERKLEVRAPDGRLLPHVHRPSEDQHGDRLLEQLLLSQVELALDDETAFPMWNGQTPDYQACVVAIRGSDAEA